MANRRQRQMCIRDRLHAGHFPNRFGDSFPHSLHTNIVFAFAIFPSFLSYFFFLNYIFFVFISQYIFEKMFVIICNLFPLISTNFDVIINYKN